MINVNSVQPQHISDYFIKYAYSIGGLKPPRSILQLIWLCCVWVLWTERNNMFFNNKAKSIPQLPGKVKVSYFWWMKAKNVSFSFGHYMWWQQSFVCLGFSWSSFFFYSVAFDVIFVSLYLVHLVLGSRLSYCGNTFHFGL